jgi:hypothetical protein
LESHNLSIARIIGEILSAANLPAHQWEIDAKEVELRSR